MRTVLTLDDSQMGEWTQICRAYARKIGAELIFVNNTSMGIQTKEGELRHIYIDELYDILAEGV